MTSNATKWIIYGLRPQNNVSPELVTEDGSKQEFYQGLSPDLQQLYKMAYNRKPKAFHHKARTGCITCKRRRVKCDEGKPTCTRCKSGGYLCDGYQHADAKIFESSASSTAKPPTDEFVNLANRLSDSFPEQSMAEKRALAFFRERTAPTLAAFARASEPFWLYTAGQYAQSEKAVYYTIIALATRHEINQSVKEVQPSTMKLCESAYSAALRTLVQQGQASKDIQAQRNHEDRVLQCCALLVAYEIIHDPTAQSDVGLTHILSGIRILEQRQQASTIGLLSSTPYGIASASNEMMFAQLGLIVPMFAAPAQSDSIILPSYGLWARPKLPSYFKDLDEAKRIFFDICRWYWQGLALQKSSQLRCPPALRESTRECLSSNDLSSSPQSTYANVSDLLQGWWSRFQPFTKDSEEASFAPSDTDEVEKNESSSASYETINFTSGQTSNRSHPTPNVITHLSSAERQRAACFWTQFYLLSIAFRVSTSSASTSSSGKAASSYHPGMYTLRVDLSDPSQRTITSTYAVTSSLLKKTLKERHQRGTPTIHAGMDWLWPMTDVVAWEKPEAGEDSDEICIMRSVMNRM